MSRRQISSLIAGGMLCLELAALWTRPVESKMVMQTVYEALWLVAPRPAGMEDCQPPPRFR